MDKDLGHINYDSDADCVYFVVTAQNYPQRTAFSLMEELKSGFKEQWAHEVDDALPRSLTKGTKRFLSSLASKFDNLEAVDKLSGVRAQVDEVTGIMNDNVTQMLKQGENLDVLSDKTNDLNYEASKFHKQSTTLKRQAWWKVCRPPPARPRGRPTLTFSPIARRPRPAEPEADDHHRYAPASSHLHRIRAR